MGFPNQNLNQRIESGGSIGYDQSFKQINRQTQITAFYIYIYIDIFCTTYI